MNEGVSCSLTLISLVLLVYARLTSFVPALIVTFLVGLLLTMISVPVGPLLLRVTPHAYIGRVDATLNSTIALMQVLGATLAGFLASNVLLHLRTQALGLTFGPIDTIFTGGVALALLGALYALLRLGWSDPAPVREEAPVRHAAEPLTEAALIE